MNHKKHEIDYVTKHKDPEDLKTKRDIANENAIKSVCATAILGLIYGFMKMAGYIYPEMTNPVWFRELIAGGALASFMTGAGFKMAAIHFGDIAKKIEKAAKEMAKKSEDEMNKKNEELNVL